MTPDDWDDGFGRSVAVFLNGDGIAGRDWRGQPIVDDHVMVWMNAHDEPVTFVVPNAEHSIKWLVVVDTAGRPDDRVIDADEKVEVAGRSVVVLLAHVPSPEDLDSSVAASIASGVAPGSIDES
jgi:glycogen operon protein